MSFFGIQNNKKNKKPEKSQFANDNKSDSKEINLNNQKYVGDNNSASNSKNMN